MDETAHFNHGIACFTTTCTYRVTEGWLSDEFFYEIHHGFRHSPGVNRKYDTKNFSTNGKWSGFPDQIDGVVVCFDS